MSKKVYKSTKKYACPYCDAKLNRMDLISHVESKHEALIPEDYSATRVVYESINKTNHGICMICKKPVYDWNEKLSRYNNLCGSDKCRAEVRRIALERHIKTYNTPTLLNDPEHQEKMLANRKISGKYKHSDGGEFTYTGKFEKATIEFMDKVLNIPSKDIQMPGPILEYDFRGEKHSWITDIYYIPANLIIEVKDGGDNPNNRSMPEYRAKQIAKEQMVTELGTFNYLRLTNNNFAQLLEVLAEIKYENMDQSEAPKVVLNINESLIIELAIDERAILNEGTKSELDDLFEKKKKLNLSSFKKIRITKEVIEKYKKEYPVLKHVRCDDTNKYICDGYMWLNNHDNLVCHVGSCEYLDDHTKWIVSLEIFPEYKGHGLSRQILDFAVKSMGCKYLSVNKNNKVAKYVYDSYGFKTYQSSDSMDYMTIDKHPVTEEVGGIPPQRSCQPVIVPYLMGNTFTAGITDTEMDDIFVKDETGEFQKMPYPDFSNTHDDGTLFIMNSQMPIHEAAEKCPETVLEFLEILMGRKLRTFEELFLDNSLKKYDKTTESVIPINLRMRGMLIENELAAGIRTHIGIDKPIKGAVMLGQNDKGYYVFTPSDYSLSSNYYDSPESIPQNIIDTMADLYDQHRKREGGSY